MTIVFDYNFVPVPVIIHIPIALIIFVIIIKIIQGDQNMSSKNPIFGLLWLILLIFIAWPVAGFCAGFWILLQVCFGFVFSVFTSPVEVKRKDFLMPTAWDFIVSGVN